MADNIENRFQQRTQRVDSSVAGWVIGAVIAILAIAAVWYYGTRSSEVGKTTGTTTGAITTEQPATKPAAPATQQATPPAPAPAPANP